MVGLSGFLFLGITLRVAMFRSSLSLGPPLRCGLPSFGRHYCTALMRDNVLYGHTSHKTTEIYTLIIDILNKVVKRLLDSSDFKYL